MKKTTALFSALLLMMFSPTVFAGNPLAPAKGSPASYSLPKHLGPEDLVAKTVVFRLKPELRSSSANSSIDNQKLNAVFSTLGISTMKTMFPNHQAPEKEKNSFGLTYADISLIYELVYTSNTPIEEAVNMVLGTGTVLYAEPKFAYKPFVFTPNDAQISNAGQYFIAKTKADSAWAINPLTTRGDTNVVIGIVDTGTDWDHPDLVANLKLNYSDPIDGTDNDGDGFIDNYRGWDLADNDNDPLVAGTGGPAHGSHVSGCADACTDNTTGVAGIGFKCKFLPVKASMNSDANAYLVKGFEGITYAADHGCSVINCSWGNDSYTHMGQDVITYATLTKNALVVCAAGNDGLLKDYYPAAYDYVISVAATTNTDAKASFSNYGYSIDVSAPGNNIYSTFYNNNYSTLSGTSMASPIAAGGAAIIKSFYGSTYNAIQVGEKLRVTCDNIESQLSATVKTKMGKGRINLYKALTLVTPSVRMINMVSTDTNDDTFVIGDTVRVKGDFINYLDPTTNLTATLSTTSTYVTVLNPTINVGVLGTLATFNINSNPFSFKINPSAPANTSVPFKLIFSDGSYSDIQWVNEVINVDYINITINDVFTSNTSKGAIGYNATGQTQGLGFTYHDSAMVYEAGLMIGVTDTVSDNVRGATGGSSDADFTKVNTIVHDNPNVISHFDLSGSFNDNGALTEKLNVLVKHRSFAWDSVPCKKFVIFQYKIISNRSAALNGLFAGIFADWDITEATYHTNEAAWDAANRMGYVFNTGSSLYAGTKLLSHRPNHHYAIDNETGGGGGIDISAGYTSTLKYQTMSTDRDNAGASGGADVCNVVSTGPFTMHIHDTITVAFALIAGDNLADLQASAVSAQTLYDQYFQEDSTTSIADQEINQGPAISSFKNSPNPAIGKTKFSFHLTESGITNLELFDVNGKKVMNVFNESLEAGEHFYTVDVSALAPGIYFSVLTQGSNSLKQKFVVANE